MKYGKIIIIVILIGVYLFDYANKFHGRKTASGKRFDNTKLTCAHKTLPFGTFLKIINPMDGRFVIVEVIDRGPYIKKRVVDLSRSAFLKIGSLEKGILNVEIEKIDSKKMKNLVYEPMNKKYEQNNLDF